MYPNETSISRIEGLKQFLEVIDKQAIEMGATLLLNAGFHC